MKPNVTESSTTCEQKHRSESPCEGHSQPCGGGPHGAGRLRDIAPAAVGRHQSENAQCFLLEISAEFASRDYQTTLKRLAIRSVPFLADFCFIDVLAVDGTVQRVSWAHADSANAQVFDVIDKFVPSLTSVNDPVSRVLRTGQAEFVPEVTDAWIEAAATSQQHFELMRDLDLRSLIAVPLTVPGLTLGVLTFCYSASSGRHYRAEDLWLAEDLARRAALVVENDRLYHELEDASRRKDDFLAMMGHELRNPLAPIRNAMEIFRLKVWADLDVREVTAMVDRQIQQLTRLVDDLVDVSRVGHGKINLDRKAVDLRNVAALAVEISRPLIDARKHILKLSLPKHAVEVDGDAARLTQVVSNLLNNSAKYSDDAGHIELLVESTGNEAVLRVRDQGVGIAAPMLPKIFDLFTQVKTSTRRCGDGLGIGLALVRNIIELHGGCVHAASGGLGHGTEFVVRLPLLVKEPAESPAEQAESWSEQHAPRRQILLVDDNHDAADSMAILLRLAGHTVRVAYDGATALTLARLQRPEVVICDISMPGMSGIELARHLRQDPELSECLLVALSGFAQEDDQNRSQECGFNAHLAKPVRLDRLKALLASADVVSAGPSRDYSPVLSAS